MIYLYLVIERVVEIAHLLVDSITNINSQKNTVCQQRRVVIDLRTSADDWEQFDLKNYGFSVN